MAISYVKITGILLLLIVIGASSFMLLSKPSIGENQASEPTVKTDSNEEQGYQEKYEVRMDSNTRLLGGYPVVVVGPKDAKLELYVFYDLYCPYCAREFTESLDYMISLTERGVKLVFVDTVVHPEAVDMHAELRCVAASGGPYVEILKDLYASFVEEGKPPSMELLKQLESKYGYKGHSSGDCTKKEKFNAVSMTQYAIQQLGVPGTPTKVIYNLEKNKAWALPGYMPLEAFKGYMEDAIAGKDLSTRQPS
ncbi:MAG: thioredoxin domain-containing protein [Desulfurococcales archaeon]|nr:thioredoxin domain-containing protein [Desulfurococcales archaeon]